MIVKPESMDFSGKNIIMIISGQPGVGKTTLALSAPDVVLVDADEGMARVKPEHRRDSSMVKTYEELLEDIRTFEGRYRTVVIDTCGALIDLMKDWAMRNEPTASKKSGGFSQQGYGFIKTEFLRLSAELRKKFNVVYLFHASKDRQDENVFYDIVCEGSAKTLVWQPADLGAYLHIVNGKRYLGFTPTMNYNAKSAYGIKGLVEVPELLDGEPNDFLCKLFLQVKANIAREHEVQKTQQEAYEEAMAAGMLAVNTVTEPEHVQEAVRSIEGLAHALTSKKELKTALSAKCKELGFTYNKEKKTYERAQ